MFAVRHITQVLGVGKIDHK